MTVKLGVAPIAWSNDDMPELGGETSLEQCLSEARQAGFIGIESGGKFPKTSEELIPILKKLALDKNIKTITPAAISRVRGRSSKLIIRLSVKTINGYKAIARKGKTAQEVFISIDLSRDELKQIIDIYNE